tara:strand:+ start:1643 stop:2293 length:651 start_codon:yes stop_codon:yes gene_type:complete
MEDRDKDDFKFLKDEDSIKYFANVDFDLKAGKHIQNYSTQFYEYDYIVKFFIELRYYYSLLFGVSLTKSSYGNENYYYLQFEDGKGSFKGSLSERLSSRHTLFGLLLLKIHRLDKHFSDNRMTLDSLKNHLKDSSNIYRDDIYRLFARVQSPEMASEPDEQNVDSWIVNSLNKFEQLGWIVFEDEHEFKILPSFNRLFEMYKDTISNFDSLSLAND